MLSAGVWTPNQQNKILFALVNSSGAEVSGLGGAFTLEISKNGGAFVAGAGTKAEIASGWYSYLSTAAEADTVGPVAIKITHGSIVQQNLEYVVKSRTVNAVTFTYTLTEPPEGSGTPIADAEVIVYTDEAMTNRVTKGQTDAFGQVEFFLDPGTYYFRRKKDGFTFDNPDTEVVS